MNGIENITKRIAEEAEAEAKKILADAEAEALRIRSEYEGLCAKKREEILARGKKIADERASRISGAATLEAKKAALTKKQELISDAFSAACEKLSKLSDDKRALAVARLALLAANGGKGEIILSKAERDAIGAKVIANCSGNTGITLSEETREIGPGLIFRDGTAETNCTFRALVEELRDRMSREIADILFG